MNRAQLEHIIRAAAGVVNARDIVVVGSQSILGTVGWCLEVHDLAVSKLAAGREKDLTFVGVMLRGGLAKSAVIRERLQTTSRLDVQAVAIADARLRRLENA